MKALMYCSAAALLLLAVPAAAQDKTLNPSDLTVQAKKPTFELDDQQRGILQDALITENTEQKTPPNFQPKVGDTVPPSMTVDVMPERLVAQQPSLQPFGYAKTAKDLLVIDPMKKQIIAVLPRKEPSTLKEPTSSNAAPEPAGDSGDKTNGNETNTNEK